MTPINTLVIGLVFGISLATGLFLMATTKRTYDVVRVGMAFVFGFMAGATMVYYLVMFVK